MASLTPTQVIEENKALLKQKYDAAKALGVAVNTARDRISAHKAAIEQRRMQAAAAAVAAGQHAAELQLQGDAEEDRIKAQIEQVSTCWMHSSMAYLTGQHGLQCSRPPGTLAHQHKHAGRMLSSRNQASSRQSGLHSWISKVWYQESDTCSVLFLGRGVTW